MTDYPTVVAAEQDALVILSVSKPGSWCPDCQSVRPASVEGGPLFQQVTTAERAFDMVGLPKTLINRFRQGRGRYLRVPWKGPHT